MRIIATALLLLMYAIPIAPDLQKPNSVKVGDETYSIIWEKPPRVYGDDWGLTVFASKKIYVLPGLEAQDTLLHEIEHACYHQADSCATEDLTDGEEQRIQKLTPCLLQVLKDNPEVVKFLTKH